MEHRVFREDGGRKYQATNDEYSASRRGIGKQYEKELERLDVQHRAFKAMQGGKNYWAPMDEILRPGPGGDGEGEKRVLDVGTGNGIWAIEMATEFPHVQVIGIDLSPVQYQHQTHVPDNCHFAHEDAATGLSYPDGYFDVVHLRALVAGIRDWSTLIDEVLRVLRTGGLVVFVEVCEMMRLKEELPVDTSESIAPGLIGFGNLIDSAMIVRGLHPKAGLNVIPGLLKAHELIHDVKERSMPVPLAPWSTDPIWRRVGEIMAADARAIPETTRLLIVDACGMSTAEYDAIKAAYERDLFENSVHAIVHMGHLWGTKA